MPSSIRSGGTFEKFRRSSVKDYLVAYSDPRAMSHIDAEVVDRVALLNLALLGGARAIDGFCGRRFWLDPAANAQVLNTRGRIVHRDDWTDLLLVPDIGDPTGIVVENGTAFAGDEGWTPVTRYETTPELAPGDGNPITGLLAPRGTWAERVRILTRWGYPRIPDAVMQANLLQAMRLYRRKDSPEGVAGSADWGLIRVPNLDPDVRALLAPFVLAGIA